MYLCVLAGGWEGGKGVGDQDCKIVGKLQILGTLFCRKSLKYRCVANDHNYPNFLESSPTFETKPSSFSQRWRTSPKLLSFW